MVSVSSSAIAAYRPLCRRLALRQEHFSQGYAEFDDLEQEGLIAVWHLLRYGFPVSSKAVEDRMRDWVRVCRRQGFAFGEPASYD